MRVRSETAEQAEVDPFAAALRAAIKARGLSLERLRFHLARRGHDLSIATLSYWQSGRSRPERSSSLAALAVLEEVLEIPPRGLAALLEHAEMFGPGSAGGALYRAEEAYLEELYQELDVVRDRGYVRVSLHETIEITPQRTMAWRVTRELLRATEDGFDRFAICTHQSGSGSEPQFTALTNLEIGATVRRPEHRVVGSRFDLPRPLMAGEAIIVEYRVDVADNNEPELWWERLCSRRIRELHVEVRFSSDDLPLAAHTYSKVGDKESTGPIAVTDGRLTVLAEDFGPGLFGVRWRW